MEYYFGIKYDPGMFAAQSLRRSLQGVGLKPFHQQMAQFSDVISNLRHGKRSPGNNVSKLHRLEFRRPLPDLRLAWWETVPQQDFTGRSAGSYYLNRIPRHVSRIPEGEISLSRGKAQHLTTRP